MSPRKYLCHHGGLLPYQKVEHNRCQQAKCLRQRPDDKAPCAPKTIPDRRKTRPLLGGHTHRWLWMAKLFLGPEYEQKWPQYFVNDTSRRGCSRPPVCAAPPAQKRHYSNDT